MQHVLNLLNKKGKGAIVVPIGFLTAKSGVAKNVLTHIVDEHIVYGVISMPFNVFANTGTNVSVLFFDNSRKAEKVVLIDASKMGEEYKDGNNQNAVCVILRLSRLFPLSRTKRLSMISLLLLHTMKSKPQSTLSLPVSISM